MALQQYMQDIKRCLSNEDDTRLLQLLDLRSGTAHQLRNGVGPISPITLERPPPTSLGAPWDSIALRHVACVHALYQNNHQEAYAHQHQVLILFYRWLQDQSAWCLSVLYALLNDLRELAEQADASAFAATGKTPALEECTRTISKAFQLCMSDRTNSPAESRRQGIYNVANLSIKCYFKVNKPNLCKNLVRAVISDPNTPPIETAPITTRVTWHYYLGLLAFLAGNDAKDLEYALIRCPISATRNIQRILTFLIPLNLLSAKFPSAALLSRFPRLYETFQPFIDAIKSGNVREYDERLEWAQERLVGMSVYLTVERAREGCLRVLFRKAWLASDKSSRMPISTFQVALKLHGVDVDNDEVECMVANMIYRGFIKGYISHEKQMVVLAKLNPFPSLASISR